MHWIGICIGVAVSIASAPAVAACLAADRGLSLDTRSNGGTYMIALNSEGLATNGLSTLNVVISRTDQRALPYPLEVRVNAFMPAHQHGMTTSPRISRLDSSHFRVEGLLLHMAGEWRLFVDITEGPVIERAETCVVLR